MIMLTAAACIICSLTKSKSNLPLASRPADVPHTPLATGRRLRYRQQVCAHLLSPLALLFSLLNALTGRSPERGRLQLLYLLHCLYLSLHVCTQNNWAISTSICNSCYHAINSFAAPACEPACLHACKTVQHFWHPTITPTLLDPWCRMACMRCRSKQACTSAWSMPQFFTAKPNLQRDAAAACLLHSSPGCG